MPSCKTGQRFPTASVASFALIFVCALHLGGHVAEAQSDATAPPPAATQGPTQGPPIGQTPAPPEVYLGDMCLNTSQCAVKVPNSECTDSGDNAGLMRCRCLSDFYAYNMPNSGKKEDYRCGKIVTTVVKPQCSECENNEGTCVLQDDGQTTFCQCLVSRSGANCEIIHVNVSCSMQAMQVCYSPHPQVNFTNGWRMFASDYLRTPQCVGSEVTQAGQACAVNNEQLLLSLNGTDLDTCGTTVIDNSHNKRYMNSIEVQQFDTSGRSINTVTPIVFNVYCSFRAYQDQTFPGIGVGRVNGNDRGSQVNPNITLQVTDQFNRRIAQGVTLIVGDLVQFVVNMTMDVYVKLSNEDNDNIPTDVICRNDAFSLTNANYAGLQVMRCTASTSPVMPDSTAETRFLTNDGCPVPGEATGPSWYWTSAVSNGQLIVRSGSVSIFKLASSSDVYFHCALKLCLIKDSSCVNYDKAYCDARQTRRRRKRNGGSVATVEEEEEQPLTLSRRKRTVSSVEVQTSLRVEDPNAQSVNAGSPSSGLRPEFVALLVILTVIAFVLVVFTAVVVIRAKRRRAASYSEESHPQLFALPRIRRTHERF